MAIYGSSWSSLVQLWQDIGYGPLPVTGLSYNDVSLTIKKAGGLFSTKVLSETTFIEVGSGYYEIYWGVSDMDVIGEFYLKLTPEIDGGITFEKIFDVLPPPVFTSNAHPTCIITGNLIDISGSPMTGAPIVFRPKNVPIFAGPSLLGSSRVPAYPDAFGNFSVELLRSVQVLVEIDNAGIRQLITVPDQETASLIDLLPPPVL